MPCEFTLFVKTKRFSFKFRWNRNLVQFHHPPQSQIESTNKLAEFCVYHKRKSIFLGCFLLLPLLSIKLLRARSQTSFPRVGGWVRGKRHQLTTILSGWVCEMESIPSFAFCSFFQRSKFKITQGALCGIYQLVGKRR